MSATKGKERSLSSIIKMAIVVVAIIAAGGLGKFVLSSGGPSGPIVSPEYETAYQAHQWNLEQFPDYVYVQGSAIVMYDVEPGEVEYYGLDDLGRTGYVVANITYDMVEEASARGRQEYDDTCDDISGWGHNERVTIDLGEGETYNGYMWNRSHLLADSLGGKANIENLICGTRMQNVGRNDGKGGMAYTETLVRNWLYRHQGGTVYYCATPIYLGNNLVPSSVYVDIRTSDGSIDEHVEVFNAANGYDINYSTGTFSVAVRSEGTRSFDATSDFDTEGLSEKLPTIGLPEEYIGQTWLGEPEASEETTCSLNGRRVNCTRYSWYSKNGKHDTVFSAYVAGGEVVKVVKGLSGTNYWPDLWGLPNLYASGEPRQGLGGGNGHYDPYDYDSPSEYADEAQDWFAANGSTDPWGDAYDYWENNT